MTRSEQIDSAVRQAYREDPRAARILLTDYAEFPELTEAMAKRKVPRIPWADFVARVRDLHCSAVTRETASPPYDYQADSAQPSVVFNAPNHNVGWEPPLG